MSILVAFEVPQLVEDVLNGENVSKKLSAHSEHTDSTQRARV